MCPRMNSSNAWYKNMVRAEQDWWTVAQRFAVQVVQTQCHRAVTGQEPMGLESTQLHTTVWYSDVSSYNFTFTCALQHTVRLLLVGCLKSQQHASVSQGRICSDNFMCCHTETEVANQTFQLTQSQYIDTGPTSPSADPIMPGAWSANF